MSVLKRAFEDVSSPTPKVAACRTKRLASSRISFMRTVPNDEIDDETTGNTTNEVSESVPREIIPSAVAASLTGVSSPKRTHSPSANGLSTFQNFRECSIGDHEICYGMLLDSKFKLFRNCEHPQNSIGEDGAQPIRTVLGVRSCRADSMTILSPKSEEIGVLDKKTATVLMLLKKVSGTIRFSLFLGNEGDEKRNNNKERQPKSILPLEINIQGPVKDLENVGEVLSDAGMFLQEPSFLKHGVIYRNPHFISWDEQITTPLLTRPGELSRNKFANYIEGAMNCSNATSYPPRFLQDKRILTFLKRHQIDAVNFMLAREDQFENALSLWEPKFLNHRKAFINKITREARSSRPRECLGGILADEMGMGKSLTLLALVVHTLGHTNSPSQEHKGSDFSVGSGESLSRASLIITPKSTLHNWETEMKRHISPDLRWRLYHGQGTKAESQDLANHDIIYTTYETVFHDSIRSATLQAVTWFRVVLDEAHHIRNRKKAFRAVMNLKTERRWCLTGTPVQNSLDDLFSLTEFLGFYPVENRLNARRWILDPLGARDDSSVENLQLVLKSAMLRRFRDSQRNGRRSEHEVKVILSPAERELYKSIRSKARTCLSPHDRPSYILRMRQVCSHGLRGPGQRLENAAAAREVIDGPTVCHRCGESFSLLPSRNSTLKSSKAFQLCFECVDEQGGTAQSTTESQSLQDSLNEGVGTSESDFDVDMLDCTSENDVDMDRDQITLATSEPSTKIRTVLDNLLKLQQERHQDTSPIKSLVFSVWTTTLDALESALLSHHLPYTRIDGSLSLQQRSAAIHSFKTDLDLRIMLLSFGTGSVGLNLTPATHVHLMEPQWNPMVEVQAAARVDRLDQEKDIVILRYIVEESIEKLIRARQNRKLWLAKLTTSPSTGADQADIVDDADL